MNLKMMILIIISKVSNFLMICRIFHFFCLKLFVIFKSGTNGLKIASNSNPNVYAQSAIYQEFLEANIKPNLPQGEYLSLINEIDKLAIKDNKGQISNKFTIYIILIWINSFHRI